MNFAVLFVCIFFWLSSSNVSSNSIFERDLIINSLFYSYLLGLFWENWFFEFDKKNFSGFFWLSSVKFWLVEINYNEFLSPKDTSNSLLLGESFIV